MRRGSSSDSCLWVSVAFAFCLHAAANRVRRSRTQVQAVGREIDLLVGSEQQRAEVEEPWEVVVADEQQETGQGTSRAARRTAHRGFVAQTAKRLLNFVPPRLRREERPSWWPEWMPPTAGRDKASRGRKSKKSDGGSRQQTHSKRDVIMSYNAVGARRRMTVTRPSRGETLYDGEPKKLDFGFQHREYLAVTGEGADKCIQPVFTRSGSGRLCSVGLFTQRQLTCTPLGNQSTMNKEYERLVHLMPKVDRGFGVEFEFVARPQAGSINGVKSCFTKAAKDLEPRLRSKWNWEEDRSVAPLSVSEAEALGGKADESKGIAFEVTAPGPPNVLHGEYGFKAVVDVLNVLRHIGIQAGPTQGFHVHVNLWNPKVAGERFSRTQAFYVWAAYAKYQFAIDEMFSPSRPGSNFAQRLFLGNCKTVSYATKCTDDPCGCTRSFFFNMHDWVRKNKQQSGSDEDFCNSILTTPGSDRACGFRHPHQRYFQVNLVPMSKFGTIEFRAHSGTYDAERVLRWVQFCVGFVERFGRGEGVGMDEFFKGGRQGDYAKLQHAQQTATAEDMFEQLRGFVAADTEEFYRGRLWETRLPGSHGCAPEPGGEASLESQRGGEKMQAACGHKPKTVLNNFLGFSLPGLRRTRAAQRAVDAGSEDGVGLAEPAGLRRGVARMEAAVMQQEVRPEEVFGIPDDEPEEEEADGDKGENEEEQQKMPLPEVEVAKEAE